MILPNIGGSTDEVVITHETSILVSNFNLGVIHEAKSDAVILNTQPYIGPLKHIFFLGGRGWTKPSNTNLSLCALALLLMISFPGPSIYMYNQSFSPLALKSKC